MSSIDGVVGNLEGDGLIRLTGEEQVLEVLIWRFNLLFERGHEAMSRLHSFLNLRVVDFKSQRALFGYYITRFGYSVPWSSDLDYSSSLNLFGHRGCSRGCLGYTSIHDESSH